MSLLIHRWLFLYSMLIFVLKDSQSLFLRHVQSGKCITAGGLVYDTRGWSLPYWAIMTENCLNVTAQFRYLDSEILYNTGKNGTFVSARISAYKGRLAIYRGIKPGAKRYEYNAIHRLKQRATGTLYFYNKERICAETSQTDYYVKGVKTCEGKPEQNFTFGSVTEYNARMENVGCSKIQHMMIQTADYGNYDNNGTFNNNATIDTQCSKLTNCLVKSLCGGNRSCELTMDNNLLPSQYCSDTSKQTYTKYTCVDKYQSNSITGPNVRLSQSPLQGFIEVKNDSTWRKINEERWNEHRQKMLCKHLGFNETDKNNIETRNIGSGNEIATGDLICYRTQPSGTSCCIHLEPSITTAITTIPYVTCGKICDKPLLQNLTNSAFSGSGGSRDYEQGKFSNDGWCGTGSEYLSIDLQKEYHITRVVTMGDRNQTKWSGSFALTYSHNESFVRRHRVQITGNQNGYRASITTIDIYNVRYIKIESTTSGDFCLRIELCGEVQSPAPVQEINVKPSNFSVHLSWTIPEAKMSSYITHFMIYLNGTQSESTLIVKISRMKYGNEFVLRGLKPYTEYTVGIQAQDGSLKNTTIVYQSFRTEEAVPSGPPLDVTVHSHSSDSLGISWKAPAKNLRNGRLTGYQVCYSSSVIDENQNCLRMESSVLSYNIPKLKPSTKYFVTVAASTKIDYGNKSLAISKITNGEPLHVVAISYSRLNVTLAKQATYIKAVMVVVQIASKTPTPVEGIQTNDLKPYQTNTKDPYITAYFKADVLPLTFVIGDAKEYKFENKRYINHPLKQNSSYIVFLRFFETKDSYYSTEWSVSVKTLKSPELEAKNPLTMSYYTLSLDIPKQKDYIREVMVIVENAIRSSTRSENLRASDLKPYQKNIKGPYVTAYIKADVLPLTFVIGDGREYNSEDERYFNHPLEQNSNYTLLILGSSYYSTVRVKITLFWGVKKWEYISL